jgi:hypothetical protein
MGIAAGGGRPRRLANSDRQATISGISAQSNMTRKRIAAAAKAPASFVYRGVLTRWPQTRTKRTETIYAAARKVMNLDPAEPAVR